MNKFSIILLIAFSALAGKNIGFDQREFRCAYILHSEFVLCEGIIKGLLYVNNDGLIFMPSESHGKKYKQIFIDWDSINFFKYEFANKITLFARGDFNHQLAVSGRKELAELLKSHGVNEHVEDKNSKPVKYTTSTYELVSRIFSYCGFIEHRTKCTIDFLPDRIVITTGSLSIIESKSITRGTIECIEFRKGLITFQGPGKSIQIRTSMNCQEFLNDFKLYEDKICLVK